MRCRKQTEYVEKGIIGLGMKFDAMSLAAAVFVVGLLLSSFGTEDTFYDDQEPPTALQQGFALR